MRSFQECRPGECVYCNHCLPCPSGIDIGPMIRLYGTREHRPPDQVQREYSSFESPANSCSECGVCTERCQFGVDVVAKMREISKHLCSQAHQ